MRIINFAPYDSYTITLFAENELVKLDDIIYLLKAFFSEFC